jgi:ABC-type transport system substrate-binding protein
LNQWYAETLVSTGPFNGESHYRNPAFDRSFYAAQAELKPSKAQDLWHALQKQQYDSGPYLVWAFVHYTDAVSNKVRGIGEPGSGWLYGLDDHRVWNWGLA